MGCAHVLLVFLKKYLEKSDKSFAKLSEHCKLFVTESFVRPKRTTFFRAKTLDY